MTNKHGHKFVGKDKYGSLFLSNSDSKVCVYCEFNDITRCSHPIAGYGFKGYCSYYGENGYYYDMTEEKIKNFLND